MHFFPAALLTTSLLLSLPCHALTPAETAAITRDAERGSDSAQLRLGMDYLYGDAGKPINAKLAAYWLELAGEQNNSAAQQMLGDLYASGLGVARNLVLSAEWRKKAASRGSTDAQLSLGKMYLSGEGVEKSQEQAERWFKRAARKGNIEAQDLLIAMYHSRTSHLLESRADELEENLLADSAQESYRSSFAFLQFVENIVHEFIQVFHHSSVSVKNQAQAGAAQSQYRLATQHESGFGAQRDYGKALYWFQRAAENGNVDAMKSLAHIYSEGIDGVAPDRKISDFWAEKARAAEKP